MPRTRDSSDFARRRADARRTAQAFRQGDPEAVEEVRRYVHRFLSFRGLGLAHEDLPDMEQQVMTEVWQAVMRPTFDLDAGFWGFVETVTARRSVDALRRRRPTTELPESLEDRDRGPLDSVLTAERTRLGQEVLERLEAPCRELIELHALRRLTYAQIAPILGKSEGALRVRMHRCVEAARRLLAEIGRTGAETRSGRERRR